jgi:DHA2 family multidrug resistance protein
MSGAAASAAGQAAAPAVARGPITASMMLATIMYAIDSTIANVALPHMQGSLSAALDQITWVLTSFIVAQALMTPLIGWINEHIGRKRLMLISIIGFTTASAACGLAQNLPEMVFFRVLQGVSGAAFMPLSQAVMFDITPREKHGQAMAVFGAGVVFGPIIGPLLGGWITEHMDWRWVFLINLPVGVIAFLGVSAFLPEKKAEQPRRFDFLGYGAIALFIASLQLMLDRGPGEDWMQSWEIRIEALLAAIGLYVFVLHTITAQKPFFDRTLLRDWNFAMGCILSLATGVLMFSALALLPPMMANILGYPVVKIGVVTAPRGLGMLIAMGIVGRLSGKVDPRILLTGGFLLNAFSLWEMTMFSPQMGDHLIITSGIIQGLALGLIFTSSNTLAFATLPPRLRTDGAAVFTLARSLGSAVGISMMQAIFVNNLQTSYSDLIQNVRPDNPVMAALPPGSVDMTSVAGLSFLAGETARQASMVAYIDDFQLSLWLTLLVMPLIIFLRPPQKSGAGRTAAPAAPPHALSE